MILESAIVAAYWTKTCSWIVDGLHDKPMENALCDAFPINVSLIFLRV